jgi:CBS-domain-containing membrane protein
MNVADLAVGYLAVCLDDPAVDVVRLLAKDERSALIVVDDRRRPVTILGGAWVLARPGCRPCRLTEALGL